MSWSGKRPIARLTMLDGSVWEIARSEVPLGIEAAQ